MTNVFKINTSEVSQSELDKVAELTRMLQEAKAQVKGKQSGVTLAVKDNGKTGADRRTHIEVKGVGARPHVFYKQQLRRFLECAQQIEEFIKANEEVLTEKK